MLFRDLKIDKENPLPIYIQFKKLLDQAINFPENAELDSIPYEESLCETFEISRRSAGRAIKMLVEEGKLYRVKRKGTFINREALKAPNAAHNSKRLGVLFPNAEAWSDTISAIRNAAKSLNFSTNIQLFNIRQVVERSEMLDELSQSCDALIIHPSYVEQEAILPDLIKLKLPFVLFSNVFECHDFNSLGVDNFRIGVMAYQELLKQGCKRIGAVLNDNLTDYSTLERQRGFYHFADQNAIDPIHMPYNLSPLSVELDKTRQAIKNYILKNQLDGVFTSHPIIGFHVFQSIFNLETQSVALVQCDELESGNRPSYTIIKQPRQEMGEMLVAMINELLEKPDLHPRRIAVAPQLITP